MSNSVLNLKIIPNIPDIDKGDNISDILISALEKSSINLQEHDVLRIAHKITSAIMAGRSFFNSLSCL